MEAYGSYYNDDGLNRTITENSNSYSLVAYTQYMDPVNYIIIEFGLDWSAANFDNGDKNIPCRAVNGNDYLGNLYFYNAKQYKLEGKYIVNVFYRGKSLGSQLGQATYDEDSDRLILINKGQACLTAVDYLVFTKLVGQ